MSGNSEPPLIVIDTNMVVSGLINRFGAPHRLIAAWHRGIFALLVTHAIRAEYALVLARPRLAREFGLSSDEVEIFLRRLGTEGVHVTPLDSLPLSVRDPKDNHVLAAALGGRATHIVTGDKDLLVL